jgi:NSS family neurotransmitter:Na+ symporter
MDGGAIWGSLFFFLLFMAALTSAISILEVVTAYFIDQKGWTRKKATFQFGIIITIVGAFCSFSLGGGINITAFFGISFFDFMDYLSSKYMLPIGGMLTAIFILRKWGLSNYMSELKIGMDKIDLSPLLVKTLLTIAAAIVAFIIFNEIYFEITGKALIG